MPARNFERFGSFGSRTGEIAHEQLRAENDLALELLPTPGLANAFGDEAPTARDGSLLGSAEG